MANWKKIIVSGSSAHLAAITSSTLTNNNLLIAGTAGLIENSGLTFSGTTLAIGANSITSYVTHGVLTGKALERINNSKLTELVITNSINNQDILSNGNKIRSIDVSNLLGEAIKRISEESSVSSLFDF